MAEVEDCRCFVGGLSWNTTERDLEDAFQRYGRVVEAKVVVDRVTGRPKGFGFVSFADERDMEDAIDKMHGKELDGRAITVSRAQSRSRGGDGGSRGYNGGGGSDYKRSLGGRGGGGGASDCFICGQTGHYARECPSESSGRAGRSSDNSYGSGRNDRYGGPRGGNYSSSNSRYSRDESYDRYGSSRGGSYRNAGGHASRSGPYDRPAGGGNRSSRDDY